MLPSALPELLAPSLPALGGACYCLVCFVVAAPAPLSPAAASPSSNDDGFLRRLLFFFAIVWGCFRTMLFVKRHKGWSLL